jgi:acetylornithine deacetylase/succinyl-diaminopimelate desuccinylase-like protein
VATMLEGGHALNALPQLAAATVNCRVLPEDSPEYVVSTLKKVLADDEIQLTELPSMGRAPSSPMRPDLLGAVQGVTEEMWPGVGVLPMMVPGATDGRYLRAAGIPTYGVQGLFMDVADIRMHGRDERLLVTSFYEGQTFMYELVKRTSK